MKKKKIASHVSLTKYRSLTTQLASTFSASHFLVPTSSKEISGGHEILAVTTNTHPSASGRSEEPFIFVTHKKEKETILHLNFRLSVKMHA